MLERQLDKGGDSRPLTSEVVADVGPRLIRALQDNNLISFDLSLELEANVATLREIVVKQEEIDHLKEQLSRRKALAEVARGIARTGLTVGIPVALFGTASKFIYDTWFSEEARKRELEQVKNIELEKTTKYLGIEPTTPSYRGFRVRYPKSDPSRKMTQVYRKLREERDRDLTLPGGFLGLERSTNVYPKEFIRSDGRSIDMLAIGLDSKTESGSGVWEYRFLRDNPTPEMDTSTFVLENKDEIYYVALTRKGTPWRYEVQLFTEAGKS